MVVLNIMRTSKQEAVFDRKSSRASLHTTNRQLLLETSHKHSLDDVQSDDNDVVVEGRWMKKRVALIREIWPDMLL